MSGLLAAYNRSGSNNGHHEGSQSTLVNIKDTSLNTTHMSDVQILEENNDQKSFNENREEESTYISTYKEISNDPVHDILYATDRNFLYFYYSIALLSRFLLN